MKGIRKNICFTILLSLSCFGLKAQTLKAFIAAAENAWMSKDYYSAVMYYNNALEFDTSNVDLQYKAAEASRMFNAYTPAETKYQFVLDNDSQAEYPMTSFWLADIKQKKGKYEEAKQLFELYLSESEGDEYFNQKAEKEIKACEWAISVVSNPDSSLTINHLGDGINSPYSEFGGLYRNEELIFSSLRYEKQDDIYNPKRLISKILKSEDQTTGDIIEGSINENELHIAHSTFSNSDDGMYYTECQYVNNNDIRCHLFYRPINGDGSFGEGVRLPENINNSAFTTTQPNIGYDPFNEKEILFFVSDKEGGKGKLDIWYSTVLGDNKFSDPINLESINTLEDDITPFFHKSSEVLYFSSEGYQSLGGFDIYKSYKNLEGFSSAEHMPFPLNSSYHDVYYTLDQEGNQSHFSSNREGSYFLESAQEACCYDIYKVDYEEVNLNLDALSFDKISLKELEGVTVQLIDDTTGELIASVDNLDDNHHLFELQKEKDYLLIASKENYDSDTIEFTTKRIFASEDIVKKLFLNPQGPQAIDLEVLTFDGVSNSSLIGTTVKLIDLETGEIVGEEIFNPEGNSFNWKVIPGKKYRIVASKDGFETVQRTIQISSDAKEKVTQKVYLGRGAQEYLPMVLYFDNDIPDLRSVKTYTDKTYSHTYHPYVVRKNEFKQKYSKPLRSEQKYGAEQRLEEFFEFDVKGGYNQMIAFLNQLETELLAGRKITIKIKGFASPRASSKYNRALSKRRTHSFKNELVKFKGGIFSKYFVSNQLDVEELPFGEDTAPSGISDKIADRRNSIYSVEASKERRIEIVELQYN